MNRISNWNAIMMKRRPIRSESGRPGSVCWLARIFATVQSRVVYTDPPSRICWAVGETSAGSAFAVGSAGTMMEGRSV